LLKKTILTWLMILFLLAGCTQAVTVTPSDSSDEPSGSAAAPAAATTPTAESEPVATLTDDEAIAGSEITTAALLEGRSSFGVELHDFETLPKAADANIHWVRYNALLWSDYQPNSPDQFIRNKKLEADMIAANEAGMDLILIVRSTPRWAQKLEGYFCGPMSDDHLDDFAKFMATLVKEYSAPPFNVKYFELWNEPDEAWERVYAPDAVLGCWGELDDPEFGGAYYGEMLKAVYPAIKRANLQAQLVLGGLVLPCRPEDDVYCEMSLFFEGILKAGAGAYFDFVNFHSYTTYDPDQPGVILMEKNEHWWAASGGQVEGKFAYLQEVMAEYEIDKPVLLTETALIDPTDVALEDLNAFEQDKAEYLVWLYVRNSARGIRATNWYHLDSYGWLKGGLLDSNNLPLPAHQAYSFLTAILGDAKFSREFSLAENVLAFEFLTSDARVWVLFSQDGSVQHIGRADDFENAYDIYGNSVELAPEGQIEFTQPLYIELSP
jgi:hypothetical protein